MTGPIEANCAGGGRGIGGVGGEDLHDAYAEAVQELIEAKAEGVQPPAAPARAHRLHGEGHVDQRPVGLR
ncbi:hypothetical protein AB0399_34770 [Streptomyces sp. NPDC088194]|uniref:hypothetical protein n=1 Tax=Streptomyces sp. NPDC088194 TaxID=3154931 RepID=UPI00344E58F6